TSILQDTVASVPVSGRGFEATQAGTLVSLLSPLTSGVSAELASDLGHRTARRLFASPVESLETNVLSQELGAQMPPVCRGWVCFSYEAGPSNALNPAASVFDAMFTPQVTFVHGPPTAQGTAVYDALLTAAHLRSRDVGTLLSGMNRLTNSAQLAGQQAIV